MAIRVDINARDLVKFTQNTDKVPKSQIGVAASKALNKVGDKLIDEVVTAVVTQTGLKSDVVRRNIDVSRATPDKLQYKIDATRALVEAPASRPMPGARRFKTGRKSDDYFYAEELVNIVTMEDEIVCPICDELAQDGPYPIAEARELIPAHPHCRCVVEYARPRRELPVSFRKGQSVQLARVTMERLQVELKNEVQINLKVIK